MNFKDKIGEEVILVNTLEKGKIIDVNERLIVKFDGRKESKLNFDCFEKNKLKFVNDESQREIEEEIENKKIRKQKEETEKRLAILKAEKEAEENEFRRGFSNSFDRQYFKRDKKLTYSELEKNYGIQITGYGRGINVVEDSIILISSVDIENHMYICNDGYLQDDKFSYCGEGSTGNQEMNYYNRAIRNSNEFMPLHLFIKFNSHEYYDQGYFKYESHEIVKGFDKNGDSRDEIHFILTRI